MPEITEGAQPNEPTGEVPFHYVLTLKYDLNKVDTTTQTRDDIAFVRPAHSRAAVYQHIVNEFLSELRRTPHSVAVLFFELSPERIAA